MRYIALAGAVLACSMLPTAVTAQQTSDQQAPTTQQSTPDSSSPPPFPPFKRAPSHRWVDMGDHHSASAQRHAATGRHKEKPEPKHHQAPVKLTHKKHSHREAREELAPQVTASKKMIRRCHSMTYKQIMHEGTCRALMKQDLEASDHRKARAARRDIKHHKATRRSTTKHRHRD